jgi:glutaminyl-peptide cyclotransferase
MKPLYIFLLALGVLMGCSCGNNADTPDTDPDNNIPSNPPVPLIGVSVGKYLPHDSTLFTEGLLFHNGQLFESTGSPAELVQTESLVGITDLNTGKFETKIKLDKSKYFGEGIVFLKGKLYQLTYENKIAFVYDAKTFKQVGTFNYPNKEGWGLTTDGTDIIMSDGTDALSFINPDDFKARRVLKVTEAGQPLDKLNELEYINGSIYANIWTTNYIVKIDPATGKVTGKLDLGSIVMDAKNKNPLADVLNGIAYDSTSKKIYVTGKLWTNIYQVDFAH